MPTQRHIARLAYPKLKCITKLGNKRQQFVCFFCFFFVCFFLFHGSGTLSMPLLPLDLVTVKGVGRSGVADPFPSL